MFFINSLFCLKGVICSSQRCTIRILVEQIVYAKYKIFRTFGMVAIPFDLEMRFSLHFFKYSRFWLKTPKLGTWFAIFYLWPTNIYIAIHVYLTPIFYMHTPWPTTPVKILPFIDDVYAQVITTKHPFKIVSYSDLHRRKSLWRSTTEVYETFNKLRPKRIKHVYCFHFL